MELIQYLSKNLFLKNNIAIVIPSKKILLGRHGAKIDFCDNVVRFNNAETNDYQDYVGSKKDIRALNFHFFKNCLENNLNFEEKIFIVSHTHPINEKKYNNFNDKKIFFLNTKKFRHFIPIYFLNKKKIYPEIYNYILNYEPSIGFSIINLLLMNKIKPKVFGIDLEENILNKRSYYFNSNNPSKPGKYHNLAIEHNILKLYLDEDIIDII